MTNYDRGIKFYNTECKKQIGNSRLPLQAIHWSAWMKIFDQLWAPAIPCSPKKQPRNEPESRPIATFHLKEHPWRRTSDDIALG